MNKVLSVSFLVALTLTLGMGSCVSKTTAQEVGWYSAQDTLRRAQVGTYSPRLAPPLKVETKTKTKTKPAHQHRFERLRCYVDPADKLRRAIICESKDSKQ